MKPLRPPKLEPLDYTETSKRELFLFSFLAIVFSPIIDIVHGVYFIDSHNSLIWGICTRTLVTWWIVKPCYFRKHSCFIWDETLWDSTSLFLRFVLFTFPAITGVFGGLLQTLFFLGLQLFRKPEFMSNFFSVILRLVVGISLCELINLRCARMIKDRDIFYWLRQEFVANTVMVSISLTWMFWQQGYTA